MPVSISREACRIELLPRCVGAGSANGNDLGIVFVENLFWSALVSGVVVLLPVVIAGDILFAAAQDFVNFASSFSGRKIIKNEK